jgi:hypothetical protein
MVNGEHDKLVLGFMVNGDVFSKLVHLVNGTYPLLTCFLSPETDTYTKFAICFPNDQETFRKKH